MKRANWGILETVAVGAVTGLLGCAADDGGADGGMTGAASDSTASSTHDTAPGTAPGTVDSDDSITPSSSGASADTNGDANTQSDAVPDSSDGNDTTDDDTTSGPGPTEPGPDFRELGPFAAQTSSANANLPSGCAMGYDRYTPERRGRPPTVILAHGFQGNRAAMANWASHMASWGLEVITPDLCHATIFDADHAANAADLVALSVQLSVEAPMYAGYSAGGLAAVLAAAQDGEATALLGLDMVDSDGLGLAAAPAIVAPALDLTGEPSMCNENNNGHAVFDATADPRVLAVLSADHCDFQNPADALCGGLCGASPQPVDDGDIASTVIGLSTAFLLWKSGLDTTGQQWSTAGQHWYGVLSDAGFIGEP